MSLGGLAVDGRNVLRIRNWAGLVSQGQTSRAAGPLGRMSPVLLGPVGGLRLLGRRRLLNVPGGLAAFGVWALLVMIAAETSVPGTFIDDDGAPLTLEDLSLLTDVSQEELQDALQILARPEVRLLEMVSMENALTSRVECLGGRVDDSQRDGETSGMSNADLGTNDSAERDSSGCVLDREEDSRRLKVAATGANPGSGVRVSPFAGSSNLPEQGRLPAKPEIRTHRPLGDSTLDSDSDSRRLKDAVTSTTLAESARRPNPGGVTEHSLGRKPQVQTVYNALSPRGASQLVNTE